MYYGELENSQYAHTPVLYAHTPVRTAEIWKICLYFPENIFLALNGDD